MSLNDDIFEDFGEPDWLKDFGIREDLNYVYLECRTCHDDIGLEDGFSLYDMKVWAYLHIEECMK